MNHDLIDWAGAQRIYFTRSRPYKKKDQATIESKNNHLVRKYGFYYRYDNAEELALLNKLWPLVKDRMNYFTPQETHRLGTGPRWPPPAALRHPRHPLDRLLAAGVLSPDQETQLHERRDRLNPAVLAHDIHRYQAKLTCLAKAKTDQLRATLPPAMPHPHGIKVS